MESKPIDRAALFKGLVVPPTADLSSGKESLHRASACARRAQIHARYSGENDAGSINWHGKASGSYNGWSAEGGHNRENILVAGVGLPFLSFRKLFHGDDSSHKSVSTGEPKVKVLILMSDTGGGHRASAMALKDAFDEVGNGKYQVNVVDIWTDHTPFPFNQLPKSYGFLVKNSWMWQMTYSFSQNKAIENFCFGSSGLYVSRDIRNFLKSENPDMIISVHPLMQHIPLQVLKSMGLLVRDAGIQRGLATDKIVVHGLPVRRDFRRKQVKKETARRRLGLDPKLPCVLLMGGGEGMGPVEATAKSLDEKLSGAAVSGQVIIVCGRNKTLQSRLESIKWKIPVKILGFTTQIFDFMNASNCIITKAGPGTIAESLICALPLILVDFIPGQEEANVPYVVDNGVGVFIREPDAVAQKIYEWFGERIAELKEMSKRAMKLGRPNATIDIVSSIIDLHRASELAVS